MPGDIRFLTIEQVLRLHALAIEDQGGDDSLRDRGLLDSALAMPRQQFGGAYLHPDIPAMAAAYAFHICKNHPFVDGNKRAAVAAMIKFLADNGWSFEATADEAEPAILSLAAGQMDKPALTEWLRSHCREKPAMELRVFFESLDLVRVRGMVESMRAADRFEELQSSIAEAGLAIPYVMEMVRALNDMQGTQHEQAGVREILNDILLLTALYRIAEDMGYEW